ncbi:MAG: acetyl-CoA decarbonylase/synthase complex subunit gamma [bacterium]
MLSGLQIFKYLPGGKKETQANCKKCGFPTCMAFAMKLAKKEVSPEKCNFISDELKSLLEEAYQVQQAEIKFGPTQKQIKIGNETVMFRHDKKFINPSCIAVKVFAGDPDFDKKISEILNYSVERVGETFKIDAIALVDDSDPLKFTEKAQKISEFQIPLILVSSNINNIRSILLKIKDSKPIVYLEDSNIDSLAELNKEFDVPVIVSANNIKSLADNSAKILENKVENLVLNLQSSQSKLIESLTYIRRAAIENKFKPLGFPVITFIDKIDNILEKAVFAAALICKYSNIIVLDYFDKALLYSLFTLRQNIFTDPQKPLQIEPKIYPIGEVNKDSPLVVTTNFALTYFTVVSEIEASDIPVYLIVTQSDGMSVLTAWAASKFTGEIIAKAIKDSNIENLLNHKEIIIPGCVSTLKEEIEEELPGWKVITGPNEAVDIPIFLKEHKEHSVNFYTKF